MVFLISILVTFLLWKFIILPWAKHDSAVNAKENKALFKWLYADAPESGKDDELGKNEREIVYDSN